MIFLSESPGRKITSRAGYINFYAHFRGLFDLFIHSLNLPVIRVFADSLTFIVTFNIIELLTPGLTLSRLTYNICV